MTFSKFKSSSKAKHTSSILTWSASNFNLEEYGVILLDQNDQITLGNFSFAVKVANMVEWILNHEKNQNPICKL